VEENTLHEMDKTEERWALENSQQIDITEE